MLQMPKTWLPFRTFTRFVYRLGDESEGLRIYFSVAPRHFDSVGLPLIRAGESVDNTTCVLASAAAPAMIRMVIVRDARLDD